MTLSSTPCFVFSLSHSSCSSQGNSTKPSATGPTSLQPGTMGSHRVHNISYCGIKCHKVRTKRAQGLDGSAASCQAENTSDCLKASGEASGQLAQPPSPQPVNCAGTIRKGLCYSDQLLKGSWSVHTAKYRSPKTAKVTRVIAAPSLGQADLHQSRKAALVLSTLGESQGVLGHSEAGSYTSVHSCIVKTIHVSLSSLS